MSTKQVEIMVGPTGKGQICIDGEPFGNVKAFSIRGAIGEATNVTLELVNVHVHYSGEAVVDAITETTHIGSETREYRKIETSGHPRS